MDFDGRLRRITDLFVEGTELYLGDDRDGKPILIWVNKLNSFEVEEARRDGASRRGLRLAELAQPSAPERQSLIAEISLWPDDKLRERWVGQKIEEIYLDVINDIESEDEWRQNLEVMRRLPTLLQEANAADDDPRRQQLVELQEGYFKEIRDRQGIKQRESLRDAEALSRDKLEESFFENWRQRLTLDEFMEERRVTELYYALRSCEATRVTQTTWDHAECNHAEKVLDNRGQVRGLPEAVLAKCIDALEGVTVPQREAGNSDAPSSSSGSSEPQSVPEESTPSTPEETSVAAPTS